MTAVRAVFFDLDDTLLDGAYNDRAVAATCAALAARDPALDACRLVEANRAIWPDFWMEVGEDWELGRLSTDIIALEAWRRTLAHCHADDPWAARLARATHARLSREGFAPFADVTSVVEDLRRDFRLAVITNGASETQREKLRLLGIDKSFEAVIVSAEVGAAKPDRVIFRRALAAVGVEPAEAWHVGDSIRLDVSGALSAGLTAVWLNRSGTAAGNPEVRAHHEIRTLADLPGLLRLAR